jgi:hypothetical protein
MMYEKLKMELAKKGITLTREGKGYFVECEFDGEYYATLREVREDFAQSISQ